MINGLQLCWASANIDLIKILVCHKKYFQPCGSQEPPEIFLVYSTCTHVLELVVCLLPDTPTHPQFPTGLYTVLLIDVSTSINKAMFKEMQHFIDQMVDGKSYRYYTMA